MAAGSIVVDLLMKTGSFETDTARAGKALKKLQKDAEETSHGIRDSFAGNLLADFSQQILSGVAQIPVAFKELVSSVGEFKDLEEVTGATAESLASLAIPASVAGVSVQSIADASVKLSKNLAGVDDESKNVGAALAALNIPIAEFKKLDPVARIDALAKAFNSFADGPNKAAVAVALFSKAGAEQLKLFKELEEEGGRQVKLTQEQIERADAYSDHQAKVNAQLKLFFQVIAIDVLPAITTFTQTVTAAGKEMLGLGGATADIGPKVRDFAFGAAEGFAILLESIIGVAKFVRALGGSFEVVAADVQAFFAAVKVGASAFLGPGAASEAQANLEKVLAARAKTLEESNRRYVDLWEKSGTEISSAIRAAANQQKNASNRLTAFTDPRSFTFGADKKPELKFEGAQKKEARSEADRYLETLEKQIEAAQQLTTFEKALAEIRAGRLKGSKSEIASVLAAAGELDELKQEEAQRKSLEEAIVSVRNERIKELESATAAAQKIGEENDALEAEIASLYAGEKAQSAIEKARISSAIAAAKSKLATLDERDANLGTTQAIEDQIAALERRLDLLNNRDAAENFVKQTKEMEKATEDARQTFEQTLGQGLQDALDGNFKSIGDLFVKLIKRMAAEAIAADITDKLFGRSPTRGPGLLEGFAALAGNLFGGGSLTPTGGSISGTYLPDVLRGGRANGGPVAPGGPYMVGERGPELFVPNTAGRIVPNGAWGGGGDVKVIVNAPPGTSVERQTSRQGSNGREVEVWLAQRIASGQSPVNAALKARGVSMSGALPVRPV